MGWHSEDRGATRLKALCAAKGYARHPLSDRAERGPAARHLYATARRDKQSEIDRNRSDFRVVPHFEFLNARRAQVG